MVVEVLGGVSVGEEKQLRVAVEGDVTEELSAERLDVSCHRLGLGLGEGSSSGVSLGARILAGTTACLIIINPQALLYIYLDMGKKSRGDENLLIHSKSQLRLASAPRHVEPDFLDKVLRHIRLVSWV